MRDPLPSPLPREPVRVTKADVIEGAAQSWPVIVAMWVAGLAVVFLTWTERLF